MKDYIGLQSEDVAMSFFPTLRRFVDDYATTVCLIEKKNIPLNSAWNSEYKSLTFWKKYKKYEGEKKNFRNSPD